MAETKRLSINLIRRDKSTQGRVGVDTETVEQYREVYTELPPPKVCKDDEGIYWLYDGFATIEAFTLEGRKQIDCEVRKGSYEDARWLAAGANVDHDTAGRRRTNADKRRAVEVALSCPRSDEKSNGEIADHCRVSRDLVASVRAEIGDTVLLGGRVGSADPSLLSGGGAAAGTLAAASKRQRAKTSKQKPPKAETPEPTSPPNGSSRLSAPASAEDCGHHDDPKYLHGTRAELKDRLTKRLTSLHSLLGEIDKLYDRIGANTGQVEEHLAAIAKAQHSLAAIANGL